MKTKARGAVFMTDRQSLLMNAKGVTPDPTPEPVPESAWRGLIHQDGHQLYRGRSFWTRSEAWEAMFMANEENGWGAVLKAPLGDGAPV